MGAAGILQSILNPGLAMRQISGHGLGHAAVTVNAPALETVI